MPVAKSKSAVSTASRKGKGKFQTQAAKDAAEQERKRKEEEQRKQEEEAIRIEEEKARLEAERLAELNSPEGRLADFLVLASSLPLSRKCFKRLDREFLDGVLIAEMIECCAPDICDTKFVCTYYSTPNRYVNWHYLNTKVFPQLGFRLKKEMIYAILRPYSTPKYDKKCENSYLIYKILYKIQDCLGQRDPEFYNYRNGKPDDGEEEEEEEEDPCAKKKPKRKGAGETEPELPNRWEKPIFSKIEVQIAQGLYDEKFAKLKESEQMMNTRRANTAFNADSNIYPATCYIFGDNDFNVNTVPVQRCCTAPCRFYATLTDSYSS